MLVADGGLGRIGWATADGTARGEGQPPPPRPAAPPPCPYRAVGPGAAPAGPGSAPVGAVTLDVDELLLGQRLVVDRVGAVLRDVLLDQPPLVDVVGDGRHARVLGDLVGDWGGGRGSRRGTATATAPRPR